MELNNMIQKVSKQENMDWIEDNEFAGRESVNKSALSSFEAIVKKMATEQIANGETVEAVAAKFNIEPAVLSSIIEPKVLNSPETKIACACESETDNGDAAYAAYVEMYGKQASTIDDKPIMARGSNVLSARAVNITDVGGPKKQMKMETANSIWDADKVARQLTKKDSGERIREKNKSIAASLDEQKQLSRYNTIDGKSLADAIKATEQRKDNSVLSMSVQEAHKYSKKLPMSGMSMFDTKEFERVPDKTAGEIAAEDKKQESNKEKDRSWLNNNKTVTSKDLFNRMIDSLVDDKE